MLAEHVSDIAKSVYQHKQRKSSENQTGNYITSCTHVALFTTSLVLDDTAIEEMTLDMQAQRERQRRDIPFT